MIVREKKEKLATNFEPTGDSDVINKFYLDENTKNVISFISKKISTNLVYNTTNNL